MRLLVHFHCFYHNQVDYFLKYFKNIVDCEWDLYVTVVEHNKQAEDKIYKFKEDAHIIKLDNIGYDVYPFYEVVKMVNLDQYDYILKVHTKNKRGIFYFEHISKYWVGNAWRDFMVTALIGSKEKFRNNLKLLQTDKIGCVAYKSIICDINHEHPYNRKNTLKLIKKLNIKDNGCFVEGTMFLVKAECLKKLKTIPFNKEDFVCRNLTGDIGTLAHSLETIFGILVYDVGFEIHGVNANFKDEFLNAFG